MSMDLTTRATGTGTGTATGTGIDTCIGIGIGIGILPCTRGAIGIGAVIGTGAGLAARCWRPAPPGGVETIQGRKPWR